MKNPTFPTCQRCTLSEPSPAKVDAAIEAVLASVAAAADLSLDQLLARDLSARIADRRMMAISLAIELVPGATPTTVAYLIGRDRGTVYNACRRLADLCDTEPATAATVERARQAARNAIAHILTPARA